MIHTHNVHAHTHIQQSGNNLLSRVAMALKAKPVILKDAIIIEDVAVDPLLAETDAAVTIAPTVVITSNGCDGIFVKVSVKDLSENAR
jgi:hypothetical protein